MKIIRQQYFLRILTIYKWMRPSVAGEGRRELLHSSVGVYYLSEEQFADMCQGHRNGHRKHRLTNLSYRKDHPGPIKNRIIGTFTATVCGSEN